ncbi:hypothetical protein PRIPAC_83282 [Pristionchus pacificus]|uniref:Zinc finger protein n=1 Tax=Pristionchus pacificus TaxID=54126 RepID=A0A2A6BNR4_PRIPA|nr:hypothetical protein PRIPAC_83282 [Pristionchus pacificus]|eukprot:PDM67478.1 zinc finger protein [Pristionchus pacificus]
MIIRFGSGRVSTTIPAPGSSCEYARRPTLMMKLASNIELSCAKIAQRRSSGLVIPFGVRMSPPRARDDRDFYPSFNFDAMNRALPDDVRPRAANRLEGLRPYMAPRAPPAAPVAEAAAARERIAKLRKDNDQSTQLALRFSRQCPVCKESPIERAAFTCGHIVCLACAEKMKLVAAEAHNSQNCPMCRKSGDFIKLFEEQMEEESVDAE